MVEEVERQQVAAVHTTTATIAAATLITIRWPSSLSVLRRNRRITIRRWPLCWTMARLN